MDKLDGQGDEPIRKQIHNRWIKNCAHHHLIIPGTGMNWLMMLKKRRMRSSFKSGISGDLLRGFRWRETCHEQIICGVGAMVLSTNWSDVSKTKVEINLPDNIEWKQNKTHQFTVTEKNTGGCVHTRLIKSRGVFKACPKNNKMNFK